MLNIKTIKNLGHFIRSYITVSKGKPGILKTREIIIPEDRETKPFGSAQGRPIVDSLVCPCCASQNFVRRGLRTKKLETVQLYLCKNCHKTFTPQSTKGKHYPLATIFDAISLYNLGYSLEEASKKTCGNVSLSAATLSNWIFQFKDNLPFLRMRSFAIAKFKPEEMTITATLAHRQLYRFRFHRAKCQLVMQEHFHHSFFKPLVEFLEMVPSECPHQYFQDGLRASEAPLTFSKTAMIVRGKQNFATKTADFVLQGAKDRRNRHDILQKFMLYNDSVTVATEVPVYITRDDIEHMKTQLGFQIYTKKIDLINLISNSPNQNPHVNSNEFTVQANPNDPMTKNLDIGHSKIGNSLGQLEQLEIRNSNELPKLITGHVDILQIRNGQVHLLDYKPNAEKERPIEQLTLYAMALSRLTGLRLFEFKCAWFDEKDYFEFFPLHVLHKPKRALRRRKVATQEGTYQINRDVSKIKTIRPTPYV